MSQCRVPGGTGSGTCSRAPGSTCRGGAAPAMVSGTAPGCRPPRVLAVQQLQEESAWAPMAARGPRAGNQLRQQPHPRPRGWLLLWHQPASTPRGTGGSVAYLWTASCASLVPGSAPTPVPDFEPATQYSQLWYQPEHRPHSESRQNLSEPAPRSAAAPAPVQETQLAPGPPSEPEQCQPPAGASSSAALMLGQLLPQLRTETHREPPHRGCTSSRAPASSAPDPRRSRSSALWVRAMAAWAAGPEPELTPAIAAVPAPGPETKPTRELCATAEPCPDHLQQPQHQPLPSSSPPPAPEQEPLQPRCDHSSSTSPCPLNPRWAGPVAG